MPDRFDKEQQYDLYQADDQAARNHEKAFRDKYPMDWKECSRRGLYYDEETELCREKPPKFDDDHMGSLD